MSPHTQAVPPHPPAVSLSTSTHWRLPERSPVANVLTQQLALPPSCSPSQLTKASVQSQAVRMALLAWKDGSAFKG